MAIELGARAFVGTRCAIHKFAQSGTGAEGSVRSMQLEEKQ